MLNFLSTLSDFPAFGHVFIISGKTSHDAEKFNISLASGKAANSDIALMVLCNFNENNVIRSSFVGGNWSDSEDDENRTSKSSNPIKKGEEFTIYILIGTDRFHVSINDEDFCTYCYKLPLNSISTITVSGDVESITQMDHRLAFPKLYPLVNNDTPDIVYSGFIPSKYEPGHVITIAGVATGNQQGEFIIFFNENDSSRQLIHFNPRFDTSDVVLNTQLADEDASWSEAEVHSDGRFPFAINQPFKIALAFTESDFKVAVNGQYLMSFSFDNVDLEDEQTLWEILTGFQVKVGMDLNVQVAQVEHIHQSDKDCEGFENYSNMSVY